MKKQLILVSFLFLINSIGLLGQEIFENQDFGFSMDKPTKWIPAKDQEILKNLEKFEFSEADLTNMIKGHNGSIMLASFFKYKQNEHNGLIPTIQINVRNNPAKNSSQFTNMIMRSAKDFKYSFKDFSFEEEPKTIEISGLKAVYFISKFSMKTQKGEIMKVRSRTYAIPNGPYFFQVNFTDGQDEEDCSELFDELVKSIGIVSKDN